MHQKGETQIYESIHGDLPRISLIKHPNYTEDPAHNTTEETVYGSELQRQIQCQVTNGLGYHAGFYRGHSAEPDGECLDKHLFEMDVRTGEISRKISSDEDWAWDVLRDWHGGSIPLPLMVQS